MPDRLPTIETGRLRLRPFRASDADGWIATHDAAFAARGEMHLAITLRDTDELLDAIALPVVDAAAPPPRGSRRALMVQDAPCCERTSPMALERPRRAAVAGWCCSRS